MQILFEECDLMFVGTDVDLLSQNLNRFSHLLVQSGIFPSLTIENVRRQLADHYNVSIHQFVGDHEERSLHEFRGRGALDVPRQELEQALEIAQPTVCVIIGQRLARAIFGKSNGAYHQATRRTHNSGRITYFFILPETKFTIRTTSEMELLRSFGILADNLRNKGIDFSIYDEAEVA